MCRPAVAVVGKPCVGNEFHQTVLIVRFKCHLLHLRGFLLVDSHTAKPLSEIFCIDGSRLLLNHSFLACRRKACSRLCEEVLANAVIHYSERVESLRETCLGGLLKQRHTLIGLLVAQIVGAKRIDNAFADTSRTDAAFK